MRLFFKNSVLVGVLAVAGSSAMAFDFTAADNAFFNRGTSTPTDRSPIYSAVAEYEKVFAQDPSPEEKLYAVEQIAKLYALETRLGLSNELVMAAGEKCLAAVDKINPETSGVSASPQYYYWAILCRLAWSKAKGKLASLRYSGEVAAQIDAGLALEPSYEGGGFDRLAGILYANLPTFNPFGPSQDLTRALGHFASSLNSEVPYEAPYPTEWKDPDTEAGEYFYELYFYYAEALVAKGRQTEAKTLLQKAIARIDAGKVAKGRDKESAIARITMAEYLNTL